MDVTISKDMLQTLCKNARQGREAWFKREYAKEVEHYAKLNSYGPRLNWFNKIKRFLHFSCKETPGYTMSFEESKNLLEEIECPFTSPYDYHDPQWVVREEWNWIHLRIIKLRSKFYDELEFIENILETLKISYYVVAISSDEIGKLNASVCA